MNANLLERHPQSVHGAVLFPTHSRVVDGKLFVRSGDDFFQTQQPQNGVYPINYAVTLSHPEYKAVSEAFGFVQAVPYERRQYRRAA